MAVLGGYSALDGNERPRPDLDVVTAFAADHGLIVTERHGGAGA